MSNDIVPHINAIITMIEKAHRNALESVNTELIKLYWNVGEYLSNESIRSSWGVRISAGFEHQLRNT